MGCPQELELERLKFDGMLEIHKSMGEEIKGEIQLFRKTYTELENNFKHVEVCHQRNSSRA